MFSIDNFRSSRTDIMKGRSNKFGLIGGGQKLPNVTHQGGALPPIEAH